MCPVVCVGRGQKQIVGKGLHAGQAKAILSHPDHWCFCCVPLSRSPPRMRERLSRTFLAAEPPAPHSFFPQSCRRSRCFSTLGCDAGYNSGITSWSSPTPHCPHVMPGTCIEESPWPGPSLPFPIVFPRTSLPVLVHLRTRFLKPAFAFFTLCFHTHCPVYLEEISLPFSPVEITFILKSQHQHSFFTTSFLTQSLSH